MKKREFFDNEGVFSKTEKIILRKFVESDKNEYLTLRGAFIDVPPQFKKFKLDYCDYLWGCVTDEKLDFLYLAIVDTCTGELIGYEALANCDEPDPEISIEIKKDCRNKGYGKAAVEAMLEHYRVITGNNSFMVEIMTNNRSSIKLFSNFDISEMGRKSSPYVDRVNKWGLDEDGNIDESRVNMAKYEAESNEKVILYRLVIP